MKAVEFVKKYGLNTFKISTRFVNTRKYLVVYSDEIDFTDEIKPHHGKCVFLRSEVRQIVDAFELVEKYKNRHGGIRFRIRWGMFRYGDTQEFNERLKQAINIVEQCQ